MKHDWTLKEIKEIYNMPLMELIAKASDIHRKNFNPQKIQISSLISIKTGGCPQDCEYSPQTTK